MAQMLLYMSVLLCASVLLFVSLLLCVPVLLFVSVLFYLRHPGRTKGPGCYRGNADVTAATCGNNADCLSGPVYAHLGA